MLELNNVYVLNPNIILRGINNKYWALDTKSGSQFRLNQLSYDLLSFIDGKKAIKDIIEEQSKRYNVEKEVFEKDVLNFLETALEKEFFAKK